MDLVIRLGGGDLLAAPHVVDIGLLEIVLPLLLLVTDIVVERGKTVSVPFPLLIDNK